MSNHQNRKIKSQKNAAILLMIGPLILLISYLRKTDFDKYGINNYFICGALITLIVCGCIGLNNSLRKEREINDE